MKIIITIFFLLFSSFTLAGSGSGKVNIEHVGTFNDKNIVFFYTEQFKDAPQCNTYNGRWTININTDIGKAQYSLLLAAQAAGSDIVLKGRNTCNLWNNSEDVHWVGYP